MKKLIQLALRDWTMIKWTRVILGGLVLGSAISEHNTTYILIGAFFTLLALLAPGTCCTYLPAPPKREGKEKNEPVYEELGAK